MSSYHCRQTSASTTYISTGAHIKLYEIIHDPTHSYDSEDEDIDIVLEVEGNNGWSRDDANGGRKKLCGNGTVTTTQNRQN